MPTILQGKITSFTMHNMSKDNEIRLYGALTCDSGDIAQIRADGIIAVDLAYAVCEDMDVKLACSKDESVFIVQQVDALYADIPA